jgi:hypothetical protein
VLVVASLNNQPFQNGYRIQTDPNRLPAGQWRETFNSDASIYDGATSATWVPPSQPTTATSSW